MTRSEYIGHLKALYLAANSSDADPDVKLPWLKGDEAATHCQHYDAIALEMGLDDNWLAPDA